VRKSCLISLRWIPALNVVLAAGTLAAQEPPIASSDPAKIPLSQEDLQIARSAQGKALAKELRDYFQAAPEARRRKTFSTESNTLLARHPATARKLAWSAYRSGWRRKQLISDIRASKVAWKHLSMPYAVRSVGKMPEGGWPLFIAMHGGGGAPKHVNDSQWAVMQRYFNDHPERGGYLYLAPRAPTDAWNGFYTDYNVPMFATLIRQLHLVSNVNPDKVYLMGVSHGGYGAFYLGMKMADRFAAIHASAAAPPGNWRDCVNLRNTVFSCMVGEHDTAHGRVNMVRGFMEGKIRLRGDNRDTYRGEVTIVKDRGHTGMPARDKIADMYSEVRNPIPRHVKWAVDPLIETFYWLRVQTPTRDAEVEAVCEDNVVTLTSGNLQSIGVYLDERLIDLAKPVKIVANDRETPHKATPTMLTLCETLAERGDPEYMFTARISVELEK